jgi:ribosomal protein S10
MLPEKVEQILNQMLRSGKSGQETIAEFCYYVAASMKDNKPVPVLKHLVICLEHLSNNAKSTAEQFEIIIKQIDTEINIDSMPPEDLLALYKRVSEKVMALYKGTI